MKTHSQEPRQRRHGSAANPRCHCVMLRLGQQYHDNGQRAIVKETQHNGSYHQCSASLKMEYAITRSLHSVTRTFAFFAALDTNTSKVELMLDDEI